MTLPEKYDPHETDVFTCPACGQRINTPASHEPTCRFARGLTSAQTSVNEPIRVYYAPTPEKIHKQNVFGTRKGSSVNMAKAMLRRTGL